MIVYNSMKVNEISLIDGFCLVGRVNRRFTHSPLAKLRANLILLYMITILHPKPNESTIAQVEEYGKSRILSI